VLEFVTDGPANQCLFFFFFLEFLWDRVVNHYCLLLYWDQKWSDMSLH